MSVATFKFSVDGDVVWCMAWRPVKPSNTFDIRYSGRESALRKAGCISDAMAQSLAARPRGRSHVDEHGDRFIRRRCGGKNEPDLIELRRLLTAPEYAMALRGVPEALASFDASYIGEDWRKQEEADRLMAYFEQLSVDQQFALLAKHWRNLNGRQRIAALLVTSVPGPDPEPSIRRSADGAVVFVDWKSRSAENHR